MGWAVDSTSALTKRGGRSSQEATAAVPLEIGMYFYMPTDTAEFTEFRIFQTCKVRPGDTREMWWVSRLLTTTRFGWRQVRTRSGMAHAACY